MCAAHQPLKLLTVFRFAELSPDPAPRDRCRPESDISESLGSHQTVSGYSSMSFLIQFPDERQVIYWTIAFKPPRDLYFGFRAKPYNVARRPQWVEDDERSDQFQL